jgi:hypothetical protein
MPKLILTLLTLLFMGFVMGFSAYVGLKHGVLWDRFGRVAARRDHSAIIFWTLWCACVLAAVVCLGAFGMILWGEVFS